VDEARRIRRLQQQQKRSMYLRSDSPGSLRWNAPDGYPSSLAPTPPSWWWGSDIFTRPLEPATALSAVSRATSLISNTIASLPWRVLTGGSGPETSTATLPAPRWLYDPTLLRPDDRFGTSPLPAAQRYPRSVFWAEWIRSALLHGMGYLIFEQASDGSPVAGTLRVLNPDMVAPHVDDDGAVVRRIGGGGASRAEQVQTTFDGTFVLGSRPYRLLELNSPLSPRDEYGITRGVLATHAAEMGLAARAQRYADGMFSTGVPAGILKSSVPNIKKEQAERLREQWMESHGGDRRSVAVLNSTTDFVPLGLSPVDLALIEMRQMSLLDVANAFGVPVYMLGGNDGGSNTYSNAESRNMDFKQFSLYHWATAVEETLTALLATGVYVAIAFGGLLRPDTKTRYEAYSAAIRDGWLTPDEVRLMESLPPLGGDGQGQGAITSGYTGLGGDSA
jgi:HK97 family phage portal protein